MNRATVIAVGPRQDAERFRATFEQAAVGMALVDLDGRWIRVNRKLMDIVGYSEEEFLTKTIQDITHPDDLEAALASVRQLLAGEIGTASMENRYRRKDGSAVWITLIASLVRDAKGRPDYFIAIVEDISHRRQAEEAVRTTLRHARTLIEASLDPFVTVSAEGKITDVNEASVEATGVPRELLVGTDFSDYFTEPDKAREGYQKVFSEGFVRDYPLAIRNVSGRAIDVLYNARVYRDDKGKVLGVFAAARDVTESRRVTRELAETRAFLDNILNSSTKYSIIGVDLARTILSWNEGARRNYGYTSGEVIGKSANLLHAPQDLASGVVDRLLDMAQEHGLAEGELQRVRKDGSTFTASVVVTRRADASGQAVGYLVISSDITDWKRTEVQLRAASQYVRSLIEASLDPLVTISPDGKVTDVNQATEQATGRPRSQLIGTDFADYFTRPDAAREGYQRVLHQGTIRDYPLTLRHASGQTTDVLYNAAVYRDEAGVLRGVFAAARDITEAKAAEAMVRASEERFRTLVTAAAQIVWTTTGDGRWVTDVPEWRRFTGQSLDAIQAFGWADALHPGDRERTIQSWNAAVAAGRMYDTEYRIRRHDGEYRWFAARGVPVLAPDGSIREWIGTCTDIHERKCDEEEIHELNATLEQRVTQRTAALEAANQELESFSYSVSHDLRVPLRAIDGFSHLLEEGYAARLDDEGRRLLSVVRGGAQRMGQLIDDVLAFSRLGRRTMELRTVDMPALVDEALRDLAPQREGRRLDLRIGALPPARGDAAMLRRIWTNLLANAIKFTCPRAEAHIEVGGRRDDAETVYWVKDDGVGFDMQYAGKLFGVFQRLHGMDEFEGTGTGLAIVKRVVARHGGRVWAEGKVNEGATFWFALPIGAAPLSGAPVIGKKEAAT